MLVLRFHFMLRVVLIVMISVLGLVLLVDLFREGGATTSTRTSVLHARRTAVHITRNGKQEKSANAQQGALQAAHNSQTDGAILAQNSNSSGGTINPHPFNFILKEGEICSRVRKDVYVLAVVHTAPINHKRRMLIRETWGSQKHYDITKTVVIFAMGSPGNASVQKSVLLESERYRDIIQEDFLDSYKNLTYKGIMWLRWVSTYCPKASFVLKVDDDIFVNIFNLVNHLKHLETRKILAPRSIMCMLWTRMPVARDINSKWYVSPQEYNGTHYTQYCSGSAYVITQQLIKPMYEQSFVKKFFWVDDFYITGELPMNISDVMYKDTMSLYVLKPAELEDRLLGAYAIFGHVPGSLVKRYSLWKSILAMRGITFSLN